MGKRKAGRPPLKSTQRKSAGIRVRLTDKELEAVKAAAGENLSAWARGIILRAAGLK
jgi:predicted DNA binding CopG/RHH family protein